MRKLPFGANFGRQCKPFFTPMAGLFQSVFYHFLEEKNLHNICEKQLGTF
jgi:hypothetical protein